MADEIPREGWQLVVEYTIKGATREEVQAKRDKLVAAGRRIGLHPPHEEEDSMETLAAIERHRRG